VPIVDDVRTSDLSIGAWLEVTAASHAGVRGAASTM